MVASITDKSVIKRKRNPFHKTLGAGETERTPMNSKGEYTINGYPVKESRLPRQSWIEDR